jgi:hypothetical protein
MRWRHPRISGRCGHREKRLCGPERRPGIGKGWPDEKGGYQNKPVGRRRIRPLKGQRIFRDQAMDRGKDIFAVRV